MERSRLRKLTTTLAFAPAMGFNCFPCQTNLATPIVNAPVEQHTASPTCTMSGRGTFFSALLLNEVAPVDLQVTDLDSLTIATARDA